MYELRCPNNPPDDISAVFEEKTDNVLALCLTEVGKSGAMHYLKLCSRSHRPSHLLVSKSDMRNVGGLKTFLIAEML